MRGGDFKGFEQGINATVDVLGFQKRAGHVHVQVFIVLRELQGALVIFHGLLQHLVLAQINAEFIEKMFVLGLERCVELDQTLENVLGLFHVAAFHIGQADAEVGPHVFLVHLERAGIFILGGEIFAFFAVLVPVVHGMLQFLHLGIDGIEVKLRFRRELADQLVHGDLALGTAGHIIGVERLALNDVAVLLNEPESLLHGFAGRGAGAHSADFLGGKYSAHLGLAAVGGVPGGRGGFFFFGHDCSFYYSAASISARMRRAASAGEGASRMGLPTTRKSAPAATALAGVIIRR